MLEFTINKNDAGLKIEKFLFKATTAPASLIYKTLRKKDVKLNGRRIKEGCILSEGDRLCVYISDEFKKAERVTDGGGELDIVYEDENIIVMNKPSGLRSQPDRKGDDALGERMLAYLTASGAYRPAAESSFVPALCNRLDRNTSGLVIGAKNAAALREMNAAIKERRVRKLYLCETEGSPSPETATLTGAIKKDERTNKSTLGADGKAVSLSYRVLERRARTALVEVELHTGRSHQIRVQLASIGCPLVGDKKYGAKTGGGQHLTAYKLMFNIENGILSYLNGKTIVLEEVKWNIPSRIG